MPVFLRPIISFLAAWVALVALGTAMGAQFILANLSSMGAEIDFATWFSITFGDIFGMLPLIGIFTGGEDMPLGRYLWSTILGVGFLISMVGASATIKWAPPVFKDNKSLVYAVAGFVSVVGIIVLFQSLQGITAIAAARSWSGLILQCLAGATAGYVYYLVRTKLDTRPS